MGCEKIYLLTESCASITHETDWNIQSRVARANIPIFAYQNEEEVQEKVKELRNKKYNDKCDFEIVPYYMDSDNIPKGDKIMLPVKIYNLTETRGSSGLIEYIFTGDPVKNSIMGVEPTVIMFSIPFMKKMERELV